MDQRHENADDNTDHSRDDRNDDRVPEPLEKHLVTVIPDKGLNKTRFKGFQQFYTPSWYSSSKSLFSFFKVKYVYFPLEKRASMVV